MRLARLSGEVKAPRHEWLHGLEGAPEDDAAHHFRLHELHQPRVVEKTLGVLVISERRLWLKDLTSRRI